MAIENLYLHNEEETKTISTDIAYYLELGRRSYDNYIVNASECDLDTAVTSYERVLEIDQSHAEAMYRLASLLWEKGQIDIEMAIMQCERAIELAPSSMDARLHLGYFFKAGGFVDEAINEFREAIRMNFIGSAKPRIALGVSMVQQAIENRQAKQHLVVGLGHFALGLMLLVNDTKSLNLIIRSLKEEIEMLQFKVKGKVLEILCLNQSALRVYEKAIHSVSQKEVFYEMVGDLYKKNNKFLLSSDYYRKAINMNPDNIEFYQKLISVLDEEIDTKEIINAYKELVRLEPENQAHYYSLGHTYLEDRNFFGAIDCLRKAISYEPQNAFYHNSLAYALVQVEDFDGAINEYQQAISFNPDKAWTAIVCQALAAIYHQAKHNPDAAVMAYKLALTYDPDCVEAIVALGEINYDKGNLDGAAGCFEKAIELGENNAQAHCNLGFLYWEKGLVRKAITHYQQAISLDPKYDIAYNNLGVAYLDGLHKPALALEIFELALKSNPNYALAYYNKARSLEALGQKTKAADYYQMALDINTYTDEVDPDEINKRLSQLFKVE